MPIKKSLKTLSFCLGALSLAACSSSLHSASTSGGCGVAMMQPCGHVHSGQMNVGNYTASGGQMATSRYGTIYQQYEMSYPALRQMAYVPQPVNYVQVPQPMTPPVVTSYAEPLSVQTPELERVSAPVIISDPRPIDDIAPPLSSWEQPAPRTVWDAIPVDYEACPPGTISGYGGGPCVQVEVGRK